MPDPTIAARVAAGVAWLDQHDPGWWREDAPEDPTMGRDAQPIDLDRLDLSDPCGCVLGHRWGHYGHAMIDAPLAGLSPVELGFRARSDHLGAGWRVEYRELTAEWRRVIRERRSPAATRAYLAGPMTGYPDYNAPGFAAAAEWARAQGWEPVSPHDTDPAHPGDCPPGDRHKGHPNACWYAAGIRALAGCDLIVLLPGWETSTGARLERAEAERRGLPVEVAP